MLLMIGGKPDTCSIQQERLAGDQYLCNPARLSTFDELQHLCPGSRSERALRHRVLLLRGERGREMVPDYIA